MRRTVIIVAALMLAGASLAAEKPRTPSSAPEQQDLAAPRPSAKSLKQPPRRAPDLPRCGGVASSLCMHPVF